MNKLEANYSRHLDALTTAGQVASWRFEAVKLRLAAKTFFTPDFWVVRPDDTVEFHEVKGFWEDDARVKQKVAAELFHEFLFVGVTYERKAWKLEYFKLKEEIA